MIISHMNNVGLVDLPKTGKYSLCRTSHDRRDLKTGKSNINLFRKVNLDLLTENLRGKARLSVWMVYRGVRPAEE
jgi:hypothetical protein